jgi:hypothetical protein
MLLPVLAAAYVYLFPSFIAFVLRHKEAKAVLFVNMAIAWSVLGWFLVLLWALDVGD